MDNANVTDLLAACRENHFWGEVTLLFQNGVLVNAKIVQSLRPQLSDSQTVVETKEILIFQPT